MQDVLEGYHRAADREFVSRYEALSSEEIYAPVRDFVPDLPSRVVDIGAGTGRDAAWFAAQGHTVTAVEPVAALREAGKACHSGCNIAWIDDSLPRLSMLAGEGPFDVVTLCAVWQHLDEPARGEALPVIARLLASGGRLVVSLRHGPGGEGRRGFPISVQATLIDSSRCGLRLLHRAEAPSVQAGNRALGVSWTWLVLEKGG